MAARQRGQRGWPFPRKDSGLPPLRKRPCSLGTRRGTQVPAHPNNVRPLARSGQCLASPAQSPAGSPPHSPSGPIEFGRVRSTGLATLAACLSPPPPRVEVKYRGPGMGRSKARARSPFPTRCRCAPGNPASQSPANPVSVPVLRRPRIQPRPIRRSPSLQSPSLQGRAQSKQASRQASCGPVYVCARLSVGGACLP